MPTPRFTTEPSTLLRPNTNFMQWGDINNKELATITDTPDTHNSSEVPFRVDSDTLK